MNESPETDDDLSIRRLLAESGTGESPALLEGLRLLRSFRALPAPAPTGELAAMLTETSSPRRRPQRHRGLMLSFALAGAMGAGTTGVAANNDLRLATESFCTGVIEQVLPLQGTDDEPQPPTGAPDDVLSAAGDAATDTGAVDAAQESAAPAAPGTHLWPDPAAENGRHGETAAEETPQPADGQQPAPGDEPEAEPAAEAEPKPAVTPEARSISEAPVIAEDGAAEPGKSGGVHPSGVYPTRGMAADGVHPGQGRAANGGDHTGRAGSNSRAGNYAGGNNGAGHGRDGGTSSAETAPATPSQP